MNLSTMEEYLLTMENESEKLKHSHDSRQQYMWSIARNEYLPKEMKVAMQYMPTHFVKWKYMGAAHALHSLNLQCESNLNTRKTGYLKSVSSKTSMNT